MIFTFEIVFITVAIVVVLGGVVYVLHKPRQRDTGEDNESQKSGDPHI